MAHDAAVHTFRVVIPIDAGEGALGLGVLRHRVLQRRQPMAQLVDCGSGMTGPKASTYRIYISLLTSISTDGKGGTTVQTTFVPMGQDVSGGSSDRIPCGSTGRFEQVFLDKVKATLGKP